MGATQSAYGNALKLIDEYRATIQPNDLTIGQVQEKWIARGQADARQWALRILECYDGLILAGFDTFTGQLLPIMQAVECAMEETWPASDLWQGCPELLERNRRFAAGMSSKGK